MLYIVGGKLGKLAGDKLGSFLGSIAGNKIGSEISSKLGSTAIGNVSFVNEFVKDQSAKVGNAIGTSIGSKVGSSIGDTLGKGTGAIAGYSLGKAAASKLFPEDDDNVTDFYIMLIDESGKTFWLGSNVNSIVTSNPNEAILIHKGENGINSKDDLVKKLEDDKLDKVFEGYKVNVVGINLNADIQEEEILEEGIISTALKTAVKVGGKILTKASPKAAKILSKPVVRKSGTLLAKKAIRSKAFRSFIRTVTKSKMFSILKNKRLIQAVVKTGDVALYADTIMDIYELISDYTSGKYRDVSWESVATGTATLAYVASPKDITSGDEEFDVEVVKEGFDSIQEDLRKYKEWKASQDVVKESTNLVFEETKTYKTYFNILFESASPTEKFDLIKKADPEFAEILKKSISVDGKLKINSSESQKVKNLVSEVDDKKIETIQNSDHKVTDENVKKILEKEDEVKSVLNEIFSKETLISLIPFSTKPTIDDINLFFDAMHAWSDGTYQLDGEDKGELTSIGVDVGITTIILATGGIAAFATFGISMILSILSCSATLGYIIDSMTRIGRNYKERKQVMA